MRKLIFGGIVYVVVLGAGVLYLKYDTRRFIERLPQPPISSSVSEQQTPEAPVSVPYSTAEKNENVSENAQALTVSIARDDPKGPRVGAAADTAFEGHSIDTLPESLDTGLSPELEALFSKYDSLDKEALVVGKVFAPLTAQTVSASRRRDEIGSELSAAPDNATIRALYAERDEISAWFKEIKPTYIELRAELQRILDDRDALLRAYGFSSDKEFREHHREAYKTWRDARR